MKWTKDEIEYIKNNIKNTSITNMSIKLERTYDSVGSKIRKLRLCGLKETNNIFPTVKDFNKTNIDLIYDLKEKLQNKSSIERFKRRNNLVQKKGDTLMVQLTDWHIGRTVKDEFGNEIYNTEVFKKRAYKLLEEILFLLDEYIRKGTPISDVNILSCGDILDGMGIFSTQESLSELSPPFQVMLGVDIIKEFILALLKRKLNVTFYGVRGNHGEIRGTGGKQKDVNANWDMQLYLILDFWSREVLKDKKVKIYYSELDYLNFQVQGWNYHIRHIAPIQSETSAGKAKFLGWARKHDSNVIVSGHFHHYSVSDRSGITVIKGGSITGADEFAEHLAEESDPIQVIWGASRHRPVTFFYAIDLGERKRK